MDNKNQKKHFSLYAKIGIFSSLFFILAVVDTGIFIYAVKKIGGYEEAMEGFVVARNRLTQISYELDIYVMGKGYEKGIGLKSVIANLDLGEQELKEIEKWAAALNNNSLMQSELKSIFKKLESIRSNIERLSKVKEHEEAVVIHNNVDIDISFITTSIDSMAKSDLREKQAAISNIKRMTIEALFISIFVGVIGFFIFLKKVISPIKEASRLAAKVRAGDYGVRFDSILPMPMDEVGILINALNDMVNKIKDIHVYIEKQVSEWAKGYDEKIKRLTAVNNITGTTLRSFKEEEILHAALDEIINVTGIDSGGIYILNPNAILELKVNRGFSNMFANAVKEMKLGEGICGEASILKESMVIEVSQYKDNKFKPLLLMEGIEKVICVPIIYRDMFKGVIFLASRKKRDIDISFLELIALEIAAAIENASIFQQEYHSGRFLERIINQSPIGIWITDEKGAALRINPAGMKLFNIERESQVVGKYNIFKDNIFGEKGLAQRIQKVFEGERLEFTIDYDISKVWHIDIKGRELKLKTTMFPIFGLDGKITNVVITYEDVTESDRFNAQLFQAEKIGSLGQMLGGVAHELNNPLTGVVGYSQFLLKRDMPLDIKTTIEKINKEAKRASQIVQNLLTVSREYKPERQCINVNGIIEQTIALRMYDFKNDNIEIATEFEKELPCIMADTGQIRQVFLGIINNAGEAMKKAPAGGRLLIRSYSVKEMERETIVVDFIDNGPGIPEENMKRLFEPFFTTKPDGTGLGLALAYSIVMEQGGKIEAKNNSRGGAAFTVQLPVLREAGECEKTCENKASIKILVVDDEPTILDIFKITLHEPEYIVKTASNGNDAMKMLIDGDWDIVITDMRMPGMDGRELYSTAILKKPALKSRFIFSTGDTTSKEVAQFLKETGCASISKPFDIGKVKAFINKAASRLQG